MRFFVQERRGHGLQDMVDGAFGVRSTDNYLELETRLDDGTCLVAYVVPNGPRQVAFVANLEDEINVLIDDLDGAPERFVRQIAAKYPTFVRLAQNGERGNLSDGALMPMTDPDTGAETVVVAVTLGGVDTAYPETWFEQAGLERLQFLTELTADLLEENEARTTLHL
ncbi:hypothetical protein AB0C02_00990 [Micromonospora sp. NPDC048999]|uniref:hypothetical protein n=1 Tax=Micromonospora sp. NPDC048999 TaxID=3155391 RepID=UPI0033C7CC04